MMTYICRKETSHDHRKWNSALHRRDGTRPAGPGEVRGRTPSGRKPVSQCESLRKAISDTGNEMAKMKAEGKENTAEYERLSKQLKNYNSALKTTKETDSYIAALSTNQMSIKQLNQQAKTLRSALNYMHKEANPQLWIAFKLYKFDILKTTWNIFIPLYRLLWIAFKLYKFDILKTTQKMKTSRRYRLWIAFKLYKFDILKTTAFNRELWEHQLWIAFKLYKFDILKTTGRMPGRGCDWLWIAFKLYKFDILKTTIVQKFCQPPQLWIAFKLYKFDILKTTGMPPEYLCFSCELLSNFINLTYWKQPHTIFYYVSPSCELLSNFINLTYWKQLEEIDFATETGCELLSNFINLTYWKQLRLLP